MASNESQSPSNTIDDKNVIMMDTEKSIMLVKSIFEPFGHVDVIQMDYKTMKIIYSDQRDAEDAYEFLKSEHNLYLPCAGPVRSLKELRNVARKLNLRGYARLDSEELQHLVEDAEKY